MYAVFHSIDCRFILTVQIIIQFNTFLYLVHRGSLIDKVNTIRNLFQAILSNGFPRLRICTAAGIGSLDSNQIWTGSPGLHFLRLDGQTSLIYGQILSLCPNLRLSKSMAGAQIDRPRGIRFYCLSRTMIFIILM